MITVPLRASSSLSKRLDAADLVMRIRIFLIDNVAEEDANPVANCAYSKLPDNTPAECQWKIQRFPVEGRVEITVVPESFETYIALTFLNND